MDAHRAGPFGVAILCLALLRCARAPEQPQESPAQYCARAEALLTPPIEPAEYQAGLPILYSCPEEAGRIIARLWQAPPADDGALKSLVSVGGLIHDGRIYQAVRAVALDPTRPRRERVAALFTLVTHYNPHLGGAIYKPSPEATQYRAMVGWGAHDNHTRGIVPLPANAGAAIAGLCYRLSQHDPDPDFRVIAGDLQRDLSRYVADTWQP
jgi:hypothetical protein